ncbi:asr0701 [Nostoc sp. PCC 7120 = FACHB-418]|nr:asr0701 [Nostoc sp. PCC 7120 = FACHB-418]
MRLTLLHQILAVIGFHAFFEVLLLTKRSLKSYLSHKFTQPHLENQIYQAFPA